MCERAAVIGFGCAGYHAVKSMREHGFQGEIDVYTDTDWAPANPMLTTYYVYGKLNREQTKPFGPMEDLAEQYQFRIIRDAVKKLHSGEKTLELSRGRSAPYDQILIATGARAFVPPIPGHDLPKVFPMRTIEDAEALKAVLGTEQVRRAVVVGASMVGIKLIELFCSRGIRTTLIDMAPCIFPLSAVPPVAAEIEKRLSAKGVTLLFSKALSAVEKREDAYVVKLAGGSEVPCDLVMMCIGTRANTDLADEGIFVNRGIVVDTGMRTSAEGIYAAGDCCEGNNLMTGQTQIIGIWANAARQGEIAGANMAGAKAEDPGNILHNITHFMGMDFIGYGDVRAEGTEYWWEEPEKGRMYFVREKDGIPVCMNFLDSFGASGVLKSYMLDRIMGKRSTLTQEDRVRLVRENIPQKLISFLMQNPG